MLILAINCPRGAENLQLFKLRRIRGCTGRWRICIASHRGEFAAFQAAENSSFDSSPNSPLNDLFSKFTSDDPREFPATGVVANPPADALAASHVKSAPRFRF